MDRREAVQELRTLITAIRRDERARMSQDDDLADDQAQYEASARKATVRILSDLLGRKPTRTDTRRVLAAWLWDYDKP